MDGWVDEWMDAWMERAREAGRRGRDGGMRGVRVMVVPVWDDVLVTDVGRQSRNETCNHIHTVKVLTLKTQTLFPIDVWGFTAT